MSNAPRAWVAVSGQDPNGVEHEFVGQEALRKVRYDPAFARVALDTSVNPPRLVVSAGPGAGGPSTSTSPDPDTIALRDNTGDLYADYFNGNVRIGAFNTAAKFVIVSESTVPLFTVSYAGDEVNMGFFGQSESTVPIVDVSAITDYASLRTAFIQLVNELSRIGLVSLID